MLPGKRQQLQKDGKIQVDTLMQIQYKDPKVHKKRSRMCTIGGRLLDGVEFLGIASFLFVAFLVVFNFPSYFKQMQFWIGDMSGSNELVAEKLENIGELRGVAQENLLQKEEVVESERADIPPLHLSIAPPDNRIIIPRIGQNVPIQDVDLQNLLGENWDELEQDIQKSLEKGVIRYPGTAKPGQQGNVFITGHSSYYLWAPGDYKDVFALLPNLEVSDKVTIYYNQKKYTYTIKDKKEVKPTDVDVLRQGDKKELTLMTCVPVGTNLNRLILVAEQDEEV